MRSPARLLAPLVSTACTAACLGGCTRTRAGRGRPAGAPPGSVPVAPPAVVAGTGTVTPVTPVTTLFVASHAPPARPGEQAPPWSLTASDGSGLLLTRVDA